MAGKYDELSREQLIRVLEKRDRERKFGLVWERDDIEPDRAIDANFVAATLDESLSERPAPWENLVIEGDNFDALRWLRMAYAGRIKCIYIDPPYNTGNKDWVYNDHYMDPNDRYRHSTWLEFLHRRLSLARDLLAEDGVLLVSISDENRSKLEMLMEEVLPGMRVGSFTWRTRIGGNEGGNHFFTSNHEPVLVFAKPGFKFGGSEKTYSMYKYYDEEADDYYRLSDLTVAVSYDSPRAGQAYYPIRDPKTDIWYPCNPNRVWAYTSKEKTRLNKKVKTKYMEEWIALGRIHFPDDQRVVKWDSLDQLEAAIEAGDVPTSGRSPLLRQGLPELETWVGRKVGFGIPAFKRYKKELKRASQPLSSWVVPVKEKSTVDNELTNLVVGTNSEGAKTTKDVFGTKAFNYAKPVSLIRELVRQSTGPGDIVLDFFAGSATTAQAVMELNAEDGGGRRFIMVSSTEKTENEPDKNLCRDVTAERVRRLNRLDEGKYPDLSAGFAYLRTREVDFADMDYDLMPQEVWSILEALHGLPLTAHDADAAYNVHEGDDLTLTLIERPDETLRAWAEALHAGRPVFIYAWAPGMLRDWRLAETVEVRPVRETLKQRFQQ